MAAVLSFQFRSIDGGTNASNACIIRTKGTAPDTNGLLLESPLTGLRGFQAVARLRNTAVGEVQKPENHRKGSGGAYTNMLQSHAARDCCCVCLSHCSPFSLQVEFGT